MQAELSVSAQARILGFCITSMEFNHAALIAGEVQFHLHGLPPARPDESA